MKLIKLLILVISFSLVSLTSGFAQNNTIITKEINVKNDNPSGNELKFEKIISNTNYDKIQINLPVYIEQSINEKATNVKYSAMKSEESYPNKLENKKITKLNLVKKQSKDQVKLKCKKEI